VRASNIRLASLSASRVASRRLASTSPIQAVKGVTAKAQAAAESATHGAAKSDMPWMIGSALLWIPIIVYLTSPKEAQDAIKHKLPSPAARNYGMSKEPKGDPRDLEEDSEGAPQPKSEDQLKDEGAEHQANTPFIGTEEFKTPRDSHPGGNTLEGYAIDHQEHDAASRQGSQEPSKPAAKLQPEGGGKMKDAAALATQGHSNDPKGGQAKHEEKKEETGTKDGFAKE